jgi:ribosomal protein L34E
MFTHPKSGEWVIVPGVGSGEDNSDKGTPKAITAAIKYIWMKTFMIAEGNDAERSEYDQRREEGGSRKVAPKDKKAPTNPACSDCHKSIAPIKKADEPEIPTSEVVRRTTAKFVRALCMGCAKKASTAPAATPAAAPKAAGGKPKAANPPTVEHVPDSDLKEIDGQITGVSTRKITSPKGTKVVTEIEFNGFDGKITSWHTEHVNPALQKAKGKQAVIVFSTKVNGRYTNHTLEKLLFLDGAVWEDNKPGRTELDNDADDFVNNYPDDKQ